MGYQDEMDYLDWKAEEEKRRQIGIWSGAEKPSDEDMKKPSASFLTYDWQDGSEYADDSDNEDDEDDEDYSR